MIKAIDREAKDTAMITAKTPIKSFENLLKNKKRNRLVLYVYYDEFVSRFWHYMSYHYGGTLCGQS